MTTYGTTSLRRRESPGALDACELGPAEPQMAANGHTLKPLGAG